MKVKRKVILIQGAFDILNWGHVKALQMAKSKGDYLIVALNSNELLWKYKKRAPVLPWGQKVFILRSLKYVDKVIMAKNFSPLELLKKYKVDIYCLTREWKHTKNQEIKYIHDTGGETIFLPRFKGGIPTSEIKKILLEEAKDGYME